MSWDVQVQIELNTRLAAAWVVAVRCAAPLIGRDLATKLAWRGALRLSRWRVVGERRWRSFR
jgi:hypothetical protein